MAQAVLTVTGIDAFDAVCIEDIELEKPIIVPEDASVEIEIHAQVLEQTDRQEPVRVNVQIRAEQTNFSTDHFSASFVLGQPTVSVQEKVPSLDRPLDIQPKRDLYNGKLLFQGAQFQRIHAIYALDQTHILFQAAQQKERTIDETWLLGDPFLRDTLLQSAQLPIPKDICLPRKIQSIKRCSIAYQEEKLCWGKAVIQEHGPEAILGNITLFDQQGRVLEYIEGYSAKIIEHRPSNPAPEELAATPHSDIWKMQNRLTTHYDKSNDALQPSKLGQLVLQKKEENWLNKDGSFTHEFTTTFSDSKKSSGRLSFTSFPIWMGQLRELSLLPIAESLLKDMRTGKWGVVTNLSSIWIEESINIFETIVGNVRLTDESNLKESRIAIAFDWFKKDGNSGVIQIASSQLTSTWVSIHACGIVKKAPIPNYLLQYLEEMARTKNMRLHNAEISIPFGMTKIFSAEILDKKKYPLDRQQFSTSMEDSNLVGNIYYTHYYTWQARLRDKYLFTQHPAIFQQQGLGECACIYAEVNHLQEAMPFETIEVSMYLTGLFEEGFQLSFEYHSISEQDKRRKLAHGMHIAVWTVPHGQEKTISPAKLPEPIAAALKAAANIM
ncbi:MAG: hypothetical protein D3916_06625, partial [Candidatus Electrothrix sp. MAN1_4]|nr:hypothetical protein [Candidatus Electrothrix sp. MAN1_4]